MQSARKVIFYVLVFLATILTGFFSLTFFLPAEKEPEPIFLKITGLWDPSIFNELKKDFQKENPLVTIEYEQKNQERYYNNLKAELATDKAPDVFWWHSGWGPVMSKTLDPMPPEILSTEDFEKTYYPIAKTDMKVKGSYRGLPLEFDGLSLIYNKALLASSNFSEAPKTWTSLRQAYVPVLTTRDDRRIFTSAIALGSISNVENWSEIIGLFLLQNGVEFINKNGELVLYNNRSVNGANLANDAIDFYFAFSEKDRTWDSAQANSIEAFAKSKTAMILLPAHKIHKLEEVIAKENLKVAFGVEPVPQLPEATPVTWGSYWAMGVNVKSKERLTAWKFVKFMGEAESLRRVYEVETKLNSFGRAYPRKEMAMEQTTHPYLAAYLAQANEAKSWYLHSDTFDEGLNKAVVDLFKKTLGKIEKRSSTDSEMKRLVIDLNPILKEYGLTTKPVPKALK